VQAGYKTGASGRNWNGYATRVNLGRYGDIERALLTDPQTSGGLLVACSPDAVDRVLKIFTAEGFQQACIIGDVGCGEPEVRVV